ncbi:MAG: hypothetical protein ACR2HH_14450 [Chthoniobacterales bacterium]
MNCVYDGLGRCLKRTLNGAVTIYAYDGWKPIMEWAGDGSWYAWGSEGGQSYNLGKIDSTC